MDLSCSDWPSQSRATGSGFCCASPPGEFVSHGSRLDAFQVGGKSLSLPVMMIFFGGGRASSFGYMACMVQR